MGTVMQVLLLGAILGLTLSAPTEDSSVQPAVGVSSSAAPTNVQTSSEESQESNESSQGPSKRAASDSPPATSAQTPSKYLSDSSSSTSTSTTQSSSVRLRRDASSESDSESQDSNESSQVVQKREALFGFGSDDDTKSQNVTQSPSSLLRDSSSTSSSTSTSSTTSTSTTQAPSSRRRRDAEDRPKQRPPRKAEGNRQQTQHEPQRPAPHATPYQNQNHRPKRDAQLDSPSPSSTSGDDPKVLGNQASGSSSTSSTTETNRAAIGTFQHINPSRY